MEHGEEDVVRINRAPGKRRQTEAVLRNVTKERSLEVARVFAEIEGDAKAGFGGAAGHRVHLRLEAGTIDGRRRRRQGKTNRIAGARRKVIARRNAPP